MAWTLKKRFIGPTKVQWLFDNINGHLRTGNADLYFYYKTREFDAITHGWRDELLPLLSEEEHAAAVAAAMNPPTDRSITKVYHNWQPPKGTPP